MSTAQDQLQKLMLSNPAGLLAMLAGMGQPPELGVSHETIEGDNENIILPRGMSKKEGADELYRQHEEEETEINMIHKFSTWDWNDALVAVLRQTTEQFGWVNAQARQSFFGKQLPNEIQLPVGILDGVIQTEAGFIGDFKVSAWDGAEGTVGVTGDGKSFIKFEVKKKFKARVKAFFDACEDRLKHHSVYKGKSVVYEKNAESGRLEFSFFENKGSKNIILNHEEELIVRNLVIAPLGLRGKRTMLFTGPYGTGKTETAMRVGKEANAKDITFIYCKQSTDFAQLLVVAKQYQPAIVFLEDIDEVGGGEDRNAEINNLLNTLDGVQTKGNNITTIFTTNHEDRINKAMRRPGRIDVIVKFGKCDVDTIQAIYERRLQEYSGGAQLDYARLAAITPIAQGAVISEIAQRAIDTATATNNGHITDELVETAIASMKHQIAFMEAPAEDTGNKYEKAIETIFRPLYDRMVQVGEQEGWDGQAEVFRS